MSVATRFMWQDWSVEPVELFIGLFKSYWNEGSQPVIDNVMNYRSFDVANEDCILFGKVEQKDKPLGLVAFKRNVLFDGMVKTGESENRARQMLEECRRILRYVNLWGDYQNLRLDHSVNLVDRERKVWSYDLLVSSFKVE